VNERNKKNELVSKRKKEKKKKKITIPLKNLLPLLFFFRTMNKYLAFYLSGAAASAAIMFYIRPAYLSDKCNKGGCPAHSDTPRNRKRRNEDNIILMICASLWPVGLPLFGYCVYLDSK